MIWNLRQQKHDSLVYITIDVSRLYVVNFFLEIVFKKNVIVEHSNQIKQNSANNASFRLHLQLKIHSS